MRLTTLARTIGCAAALVVACIPATPATAYTGTGQTFACQQSRVFLAQGSPTQLKFGLYGPGSFAFTDIGTAVGNYNSIGFNDADGYIYAEGDADNSAPVTNNLLQLEGTGAINDTLIPFPANTNNGTVGGGIYYGMLTGTTSLYKVDIATGLSTTQGLTPVAGPTSDFSLLAGFLWGSVPGAAQIARINPTTGQVDVFGGSPVPAAASVGASWTYANGNLGFNDNGTGRVYQVRVNNPTALTPTFTLISDAAGTPPTGQNDATSCVGLPVDLAITKTAQAATVAPGGTISWTITVHNNGPGISSGFTVTDPIPSQVANATSPTAGCAITGIPAVLRCVHGPLAVGADDVITVTAAAPNTFATNIPNTATVTANDLDDNSLNDSATAATRTFGQADLSLAKTADPTTAVPGELVTYTLEVTNNGPTIATDVSVSDPLPPNTTFVSASPGCTHAAGVVTCTIPTIVNGGVAPFEVLVSVASSVTGSLTNTATVSASSTDPDLSDNDSQVTVPTAPSADIAITKTASPTPAVPGQNLTYTLAVKNNGPSDATAITATDAFPAGLTFVSASAGCTHAAGTVTCTQASLASGATATFTIVAALASTASGSLVNSASVTSATPDPATSNNSTTSTTPIAVIIVPRPAAANLEVAKFANRTTASQASEILWTIAVTNGGPDAAAGVVLVDQPSLAVAFSTATPSQGTCTKVSPVRCELGTIAAGATVTVSMTGRARASGSLVNIARASSTTPDPQSANDVASVTTRVSGGSLAFSKTANKSRVHAGRMIGYALRVANRGSGPVAGARVCDRLPAGLTFVSAAPRATRSGGEYCWSLGTLPANSARTLRITARATRGTSGNRTNRASLTASGVTTRTASERVNVLAAAARGGGVTG